MATYIDDVDDWDDFANGILVDPNNEYELTGDIGDSTNPVTTMYSGTFIGSLNGNNKKITVAINSNTTNVGLFNQVDGAQILDLIVDGQITGGTNSQNVGGFVGLVQTHAGFNNCLNLASVTCGTSNSSVGGIVGKADNTADFNHCANNGLISGAYNVGGILGSSNSQVNGVEFMICENAGTISGIGIKQNCMAGIVGYSSSSVNIHTGTNIGKILSSKSDYAGGIIAFANNRAGIDRCSNSGLVDGAGNYVGGIAGYVGSSNAGISNCINTNWIRQGTAIVGAIVGYNNGTVDNCYFDEQMSVLTVGIGNNSTAPPGQADGRPTSGMIGPPASGGLPIAPWNTPAQLYPRWNNHPIDLLAVAPIYLRNTPPPMVPPMEKLDDVFTSPFQVSNGIAFPITIPPSNPYEYPYEWNSINGFINIPPTSDDAFITGTGGVLQQDTLRVILPGEPYEKLVPIWVR